MDSVLGSGGRRFRDDARAPGGAFPVEGTVGGARAIRSSVLTCYSP